VDFTRDNASKLLSVDSAIEVQLEEAESLRLSSSAENALFRLIADYTD